MGKIFSSRKDYNRVLATQPQAAIGMPRFQAPDNLQKQISFGLLSIPDPMLMSQTPKQNENIFFPLPNDNKYVESTEIPKQSNPPAIIEANNLSAVTTDQKLEKEPAQQQQQQIITSNTPTSVRSKSPSSHQTVNGHTVIISRSTINTNDLELSKNYSSLSVRPLRTIVERHGKEFLVESKDRVEQRYVQYTDQTNHQKRLFEVIDCIPYRIIRPLKDNSQSISHNDLSQNTFLLTPQSNKRSFLPPVSHDQLLPSYISAPIINNQSNDISPQNHTNNGNPNNRVNLASQYDLHKIDGNGPLSNKTRPDIPDVFSTTLSSPKFVPISPLVPGNIPTSTYQHSQSLFNVSDKYPSKVFPKQLSLFRTDTSTISDNSTSSSICGYSNSDEETVTDDNELIDQILRSNEKLRSYEQCNSCISNNRINDKYNSSTSLDLFVQPLNSINDHNHYEARSILHNYDESITNRTRFPQSSYFDYSPIPITEQTILSKSIYI